MSKQVQSCQAADTVPPPSELALSFTCTKGRWYDPPPLLLDPQRKNTSASLQEERVGFFEDDAFGGPVTTVRTSRAAVAESGPPSKRADIDVTSGTAWKNPFSVPPHSSTTPRKCRLHAFKSLAACV